MNWYAAVALALGAATGLEVVLPWDDMPDPVQCRERAWMGHISAAGVGAGDVLIGHSTGGDAALRYAEGHPLAGVFIVGAGPTVRDEDDEEPSAEELAEYGWCARHGGGGGGGLRRFHARYCLA